MERGEMVLAVESAWTVLFLSRPVVLFNRRNELLGSEFRDDLTHRSIYSENKRTQFPQRVLSSQLVKSVDYVQIECLQPNEIRFWWKLQEREREGTKVHFTGHEVLRDDAL